MLEASNASPMQPVPDGHLFSAAAETVVEHLLAVVGRERAAGTGGAAPARGGHALFTAYGGGAQTRLPTATGTGRQRDPRVAAFGGAAHLCDLEGDTAAAAAGLQDLRAAAVAAQCPRAAQPSSAAAASGSLPVPFAEPGWACSPGAGRWARAAPAAQPASRARRTTAGLKGAIAAAQEAPTGPRGPVQRSGVRSCAGRVCTYCGIRSTPQWREGPLGSGTLCNACGVRWNRKGLQAMCTYPPQEPRAPPPPSLGAARPAECFYQPPASD